MLMLCAVINLSAQSNVYIWHSNNNLEAVPVSQKDSITFSLADNAITISAGDPFEINDTTMSAYLVISSNLKLTNTQSECGVCYSQFEETPTILNTK